MLDIRIGDITVVCHARASQLKIAPIGMEPGDILLETSHGVELIKKCYRDQLAAVIKPPIEDLHLRRQELEAELREVEVLSRAKASIDTVQDALVKAGKGKGDISGLSLKDIALLAARNGLRIYAD